MRSCGGAEGLGAVADLLNAHVARRIKGILVRDISLQLLILRKKPLLSSHGLFIE